VCKLLLTAGGEPHERDLQEIDERLSDVAAALLLLGGQSECVRIGASVSFARKDIPSLTARGVVVQYVALDSRAKVLTLSAGVPHLSNVSVDNLEVQPSVKPSALLAALGLSLPAVVAPLCQLVQAFTSLPKHRGSAAFLSSLQDIALRALYAVLSTAPDAPPAVAELSSWLMKQTVQQVSAGTHLEEKAVAARSHLLHLLDADSQPALPFPISLVSLKPKAKHPNTDPFLLARVMLGSFLGSHKSAFLGKSPQGGFMGLQLNSDRGISRTVAGMLKKCAQRQFEGFLPIEIDEHTEYSTFLSQSASVINYLPKISSQPSDGRKLGFVHV
jgi:hypothetical protein